MKTRKRKLKKKNNMLLLYFLTPTGQRCHTTTTVCRSQDRLLLQVILIPVVMCQWQSRHTKTPSRYTNWCFLVITNLTRRTNVGLCIKTQKISHSSRKHAKLRIRNLVHNLKTKKRPHKIKKPGCNLLFHSATLFGSAAH